MQTHGIRWIEKPQGGFERLDHIATFQNGSMRFSADVLRELGVSGNEWYVRVGVDDDGHMYFSFYPSKGHDTWKFWNRRISLRALDIETGQYPVAVSNSMPMTLVVDLSGGPSHGR